jgi:hypothetical protein
VTPVSQINHLLKNVLNGNIPAAVDEKIDNNVLEAIPLETIVIM